MTEATTMPPPERCQARIREVAGESRSSLYTPSVIRTAASALHGIEQQLFAHDIYGPFVQPLGSLESRILSACERRFTSESFYVTTDVDPVSLLHTAIAAADDRLGRPLEPTAAPVLANGRELVAYTVLPRQPETPALGDDGQAPLVVTLGRPDQAALRLVCSSGGGPLGDYDPGPWAWHLGHKVPDGFYIGDGTDVIAPEPSDHSAAEVGQIIADFLTGQITLHR